MAINDVLQTTYDSLEEVMGEVESEITKTAPIVTSFSFFRVDDKPGLFTPWWEKTSSGENMGLFEAGLELVVRAGNNCLIVVVSILCMPYALCTEETVEELMIGELELIGMALIYSASFVMELVLNVLAMLTRTLASVVLGVGSLLSNEDSAGSDGYEPRSMGISQAFGANPMC